jgi:hypothetical protein
MARVSASNAVVQAVEIAAALYGVPCYRMQSRVVSLTSSSGRSRPVFIGKWKDRNGEEHNGGMADLLLTPSIDFTVSPSIAIGTVTVPLWAECKFGQGRLSPEQKLFRDDVIAIGAYYLEIHDSAEQLIQWFKDHGVER